MADETDGIDFSRLLGAKRAHEDDQLASGLKDAAGQLLAYYEAQVAAGFTGAQAWELTMQWHRLFICKVMGLRP